MTSNTTNSKFLCCLIQSSFPWRKRAGSSPAHLFHAGLSFSKDMARHAQAEVLRASRKTVTIKEIVSNFTSAGFGIGEAPIQQFAGSIPKSQQDWGAWS